MNDDPGFIGYWRRRHYARTPVRRRRTPAVKPRAGRAQRPGVDGEQPVRRSLFGVGDSARGGPVRFSRCASTWTKRRSRSSRDREAAAGSKRERGGGSARAAGALADALEGAALDAAHLEEATRLRVEAAKRVQEAVARALRELHELLEAEQREELASLIRSGALRL